MRRNLYFCAITLGLAGVAGCSFDVEPTGSGKYPLSPALSGAFDGPLPREIRLYTLRFLDRYLITHGWVTGSGCGYGSLPVEDRPSELINRTSDRFVFPIYEQDGMLWQDFGRDEKLWSVNDHFRSVINRVPIYAPVASGRRGEVAVVDHQDREDGFQAWCLQTWQGVQMAFGMRWHQLSVPESISRLKASHKVEDLPVTVTRDVIGANEWTVVTVPPKPRKPNYGTGPYKFYLLPIADTGFTMQFWLGATEESFENPSAFAVLGGTFRQLLESVRVEPWDASSRSRYRELERSALEQLKVECERPWKKKYKPNSWCVLYGRESTRPFEFRHNPP